MSDPTLPPPAVPDTDPNPAPILPDPDPDYDPGRAPIVPDPDPPQAGLPVDPPAPELPDPPEPTSMDPRRGLVSNVTRKDAHA